MSYILSIVTLAIGLTLGLRFPDIDQSVGFLEHRSIITHSPLLALLLVAAALSIQSRVLRWMAIGVSLSLGVHLAFDLFPRAWDGYALINVPFIGGTPVLFSSLWITASTIVCFYIAVRMVRSYLGACLLLLCLVSITIYAITQEEAVWRPLVAIVGGMVSAWAWRMWQLSGTAEN